MWGNGHRGEQILPLHLAAPALSMSSPASGSHLIPGVWQGVSICRRCQTDLSWCSLLIGMLQMLVLQAGQAAFPSGLHPHAVLQPVPAVHVPVTSTQFAGRDLSHSPALQAGSPEAFYPLLGWGRQQKPSLLLPLLWCWLTLFCSPRQVPKGR